MPVIKDVQHWPQLSMAPGDRGHVGENAENKNIFIDMHTNILNLGIML